VRSGALLLDSFVQNTGWNGEVDGDTKWYLDALAAAWLLLLGRARSRSESRPTVEYVTGKWDQREQEGVLLIFAERIIVKVEISRQQEVDPDDPAVFKYPEAVVSAVPRGRLEFVRAQAPLNHSTHWHPDPDSVYQGWPGAVTVTVDYGDGNAWTLPLDGPPRSAESRHALVGFLPSLLSDMDTAADPTPST